VRFSASEGSGDHCQVGADRLSPGGYAILCLLFFLRSRWQNAHGKVDPHTVFNFVSDNDIIGGNSGAPALDAEGKVVGAIFDLNIPSLGGPFGFEDRVNRAISVSTASITEALRNVYGAQGLVTELTARD